MNAKEFIIERHGQPQNDMEAEQFIEMAEMMTEFALQVATEAVEEEIQAWNLTNGKYNARTHCESILKNIKKRLDAE